MKTQLPEKLLVKTVKTSCGFCFKLVAQGESDSDYGGICLYDDHTSLNPHPRGYQEDMALQLCTRYNQHSQLVKERDELAKGLDDLIQVCSANGMTNWRSIQDGAGILAKLKEGKC